MKNIYRQILFCSSTTLLLSGCGGGAQRVESIDLDPPVILSMKSEFVPAGAEAVIYGRNFTDAKVEFETQFYNEPVTAEPVREKSNDSILTVIVPENAWTGAIKVTNMAGTTESDFRFRESRNFIIDFDKCHQTWGGYAPFDKDGNLILGVYEGDTLLKFPVELPNPCSGNYGLLYGEYPDSWKMDNVMLLQYMSNPEEGGRGDSLSVGGLHFSSYPIEELVLKFECNINKNYPYKGIRTEIFFGPRDGKNKHGREESVLCFWEPWKQSFLNNDLGRDFSNGFYTDGWETVTIPLTEFKHNATTDEVLHDLRLDLKTCVNFTFMQFGIPESSPKVLICVDNFRIVPIKEKY